MSYDAAYQQAYYQKNKDRIQARRAAFAKANPQAVAQWKENTVRRPADPTKSKEARRKYEANNPERILWNAARQRSKRGGLEFSIAVGDVVIPKVCPLLGILIVHKRGSGRGFWDASPSIDRIDNSRGYVSGNIWVISWLANKMKSTASLAQLDTFCANWQRWRK